MSALLTFTHKVPLVIPSVRGTNLFGVLHRPQNTENPPLTIIIHGLASNKCGSKRSHVLLAEELNKRGIACLRVDLPGSGDSDGHLEDFSLEDLKQACRDILSYSLQLPDLNLEHLTAFGSSLGGALLLSIASQYPSLKSLVLWASVIKGSIWLQDTLSHSSSEGPFNKAFPFVYEGYTLSPDFLKQFLTFDALSDSLYAPSDLSLLYLQGESDPIVSTKHKDSFLNFFSNKGNLTRAITYPFSGHNFATTPYFQQVLHDISDWIASSLNDL